MFSVRDLLLLIAILLCVKPPQRLKVLLLLAGVDLVGTLLFSTLGKAALAWMLTPDSIGVWLLLGIFVVGAFAYRRGYIVRTNSAHL